MRRKELFPGTVQEFIKMNGGGAGIEPWTRFTFQLILAMFKDKTTGKIFILRMVVDNTVKSGDSSTLIHSPKISWKSDVLNRAFALASFGLFSYITAT